MDIFGGNEASGGWISWKSEAETWDIDGEKCNVTKLLIDPQSLQTGWGLIKRGSPPDFVWADIAGTKIQQPSAEHRVAVSLSVFAAAKYGAPNDGKRTWRTNGFANIHAIRKIWPEIHEGAKANPGKWAVVNVTASEVIQTKFKDVNVPVLSLSGWANLPAEQPAPPPPPPPVIEPSPADDEEFF